jgi:prephenate dehydrogenase
VNVAVVGVGLIGGSVALAARERLDATVTGWDPDGAAVAAALQRGAIDVAADDLTAAVAGADVAVVAAPLGALADTVAAVLDAAGPECVVTDVGSTKQGLAERFAGDGRYVGGHPLAGAETAGIAQAREDLFAGATWYLTPHGTTTGTLYERLHRLLCGLGAQPVAIEPVAHDRAMAGVSHLPHVLANALVGHVSGALDAGEPLPATGPSFRDATRVAGAHPQLWADIYLANGPALVDAIDDAVARLEQARALLAAGDRDGLVQWQAQAARERAALVAATSPDGRTRELRVAVTNRPGVMADIALALGSAGIGISDMTLAPSADNSAGVIVLWVQETNVDRAAALVHDLGFPVTVSS